MTERVDKFVWQEGDVERVTPKQCSVCTNLSSDQTWTCRAFPEGIPAVILTNRFDHRRKYPGDRGIRFKPKRQS